MASAVSLIIALQPPTAFAQNRAEVNNILSNQTSEASSVADDLRINISAYTIAGDAPTSLQVALKRITEPYIGPDRTAADMKSATRAVTQYMQCKLGHWIAYAYIPRVAITDSIVRIEILEGRLGEVVFKWPSGTLPIEHEVFENYAAALKPGSIIYNREIVELVTRLNSEPRIRTRIDVSAGLKVGAVRLTLSPEIAEESSDLRLPNVTRSDFNKWVVKMACTP